MKRRKHRGGVWKHHGAYWCSYVVNGERVRENTRCKTAEEAKEFRAARLVARGQGALVVGAKDVTLKDLQALAENRYLARGGRAIRRLRGAWKNLTDETVNANGKGRGLPTRALDVTTVAVAAYERWRLEAGRSRATVNYELACLRAAWRLAIKAKVLPVGSMPVIETPNPENARSGIVSREELSAIFGRLPEWARPICLFLSLTGWRVSEAIGLRWSNVDRQRKVLRLEAADTKGKEARTFPYGELPALLKLITSQRSTVAESGHVFTRDGSAVQYKALRKAWRSACRHAKCPGKLMHDMRRTAASAMIEVGVDEGTIMQLCGWKTRAMFDRYHVVSEAAKSAAVAKLAAALEPPTPSNSKSTVTLGSRRRSA